MLLFPKFDCAEGRCAYFSDAIHGFSTYGGLNWVEGVIHVIL